MKLPLTIIILTFNEERNLLGLLDSLSGLDAPVFVVDSYSTDETLSILKQQKVTYTQHAFENYSRQRNWAQQNCPFDTPWVLHLDAGERLTPALLDWLNHQFDEQASVDGFMFSRKTVFFGKWIRYGGHYPNYHLRLYRRAKGHCEDKVYDQHFVVEGDTQVIQKGYDIIDTVADSLQDFTKAHNKWALFEAIETYTREQEQGEVKLRFWGTPIERRRWLKNKVFQRSPLFLRAFLYFFYRYFLRLGFLDGKWGLVFHLLQGFWFRFLIDAYILELRHLSITDRKVLRETIKKRYGEVFLKAIS